MLAGVTEPLAAAAKTPIGPIATSIGDAITRTARNFNSAGTIRVVNFPGGGAARIESADIIGPERRAGAGLRRQRRDLLLAVGRASHRRQYRDGAAAGCRADESRFTRRAPADR